MSDKSSDREARIRARAYALWEEEGRQDGRAEDYWHRAREEFDTPSGSLDDQLDASFPASDPPSLTSPSYPDEPLPAPPLDEPAPARSATVEERPEPAKPAKGAKKSARADTPPPAKPAAKGEAKMAGKAKPGAKPNKA